MRNDEVTISLKRGQSFHATAEITDFNATGYSIEIYATNRDILKEMDISFSDPENGIISLRLSPEDTEALSSGETNWFVIRYFLDQSYIVAPKIWVKVDV